MSGAGAPSNRTRVPDRLCGNRLPESKVADPSLGFTKVYNDAALADFYGSPILATDTTASMQGALGTIGLSFGRFADKAIINLFLIPLWLLSGALFPISGASGWLRLVMRINPLTYGVDALRELLFPGTGGALLASMATLVLFSSFMFGLAFLAVNRRTTKPAA